MASATRFAKHDQEAHDHAEAGLALDDEDHGGAVAVGAWRRRTAAHCRA